MGGAVYTGAAVRYGCGMARKAKAGNDDTVALPEELRHALDGAADAKARFAALPPSHRREYVRWIEEAKRAETRTRRVGKAVEMLRDGVRTPG